MILRKSFFEMIRQRLLLLLFCGEGTQTRVYSGIEDFGARLIDVRCSKLSSSATLRQSLNFSELHISICQMWIKYSSYYVKPLGGWHKFPELGSAKARSWNPVDKLKLCVNSQLALEKQN